MNNYRVVFFQTVPLELYGIQMLSASLQSQIPGCEIKIIITYIDSFKKIIKKLNAFSPDVLCFTACTGDHTSLLELASKLKPMFQKRYIWGGPHPTFYPEILNNEGVDVVVRGEAERILPQLILEPQNHGIKSCWFKEADGSIVQNEMGGLIHNLDELPFADHTVYHRSYKSLPHSILNLVAGRGCPFNCSFCYNQTYKNYFPKIRKRDITYG